MPEQRNRIRTTLAALAILGAGCAAAQNGAEFDYCLVCHGSEAGGNASIGAPNLSLLSPAYLENQLRAFQLGYRGRSPKDHVAQSMTAAARALESEDAVKAAAAYIGKLPPQPAVPTVDGDASRGAELYRPCATCHGAGGEGSEALGAPRLAGQNDWYLLKQLQDYHSGVRGAQPGDRQGTIMRSASTLVGDEAVARDLVAYIGSLSAAGGDATPAATPVAVFPNNPEKDNNSMKATTAAALVTGAAMLSTPAVGHEVTRYPLPNNSTFPIAEAVAVPAGAELIFHSGLLPAPADPEADPGSREYLGDTYAQTMSVLQRFEASLKQKGLGLGNIVKMNVYMVGDPELDGKMDFSGFMRAYSQFFGTEEQPKLPARAAVQVAGLARGAFIEIEVILAR